MLRFILVRRQYSAYDDRRSETFETVDVDVPEIEQRLRAGGYGESGFDQTSMVGVEIIEEAKGGA